MDEDKYRLRSCGSGRKFRFCCYEQRGSGAALSDRELMTRVADFPSVKLYISRTWQDRGLRRLSFSVKFPTARSF